MCNFKNVQQSVCPQSSGSQYNVILNRYYFFPSLLDIQHSIRLALQLIYQCQLAEELMLENHSRKQFTWYRFQSTSYAPYTYSFMLAIRGAGIQTASDALYLR